MLIPLQNHDIVKFALNVKRQRLSGCESINLGTRLLYVKLDEKQTYPRDIWKVLLAIRELTHTYI